MPSRGRRRTILRLEVILVLLLSAACSYTPEWGGSGRPGQEEGEAAEQLEGFFTRARERDRAAGRGTLGVTGPVRTRAASGWAGERIWHRRANDWEPTLAADPSSQYVYQLTTRYGKPACRGCPSPWIVFRSSSDGGETWSADQPLCRCERGRPQYDPQIEVTGDGAIHAAWLDSYRPGVAFSRSTDRGRTWSTPIHVDGALRSSDRPVLAASPDGRDVYIAFSSGDSHIVTSHDSGQSFSKPVRTNRDDRFYLSGGGYVSPDGTVTFAQTSYPAAARQITHEPPPLGEVKVLTVSSADGGHTWRGRVIETFREWPSCFSRACPESYYGPQAVIGGDAAGNLVLVSNGTLRPGAGQRIFARRSRDGGKTWTSRRALSPRGANAAFPAAVGADNGDFRIWFMDDRKGADDAWNVWYRRSNNGGRSWGRAARISDAVSGTAYKRRRGFMEPYGDYGEIAVTSSGATVAVWGEGRSYAGPGGTWFNRQVG